MLTSSTCILQQPGEDSTDASGGLLRSPPLVPAVLIALQFSHRCHSFRITCPAPHRLAPSARPYPTPARSRPHPQQPRLEPVAHRLLHQARHRVLARVLVAVREPREPLAAAPRLDARAVSVTPAPRPPVLVPRLPHRSLPLSPTRPRSASYVLPSRTSHFRSDGGNDRPHNGRRRTCAPSRASTCTAGARACTRRSGAPCPRCPSTA